MNNTIASQMGCIEGGGSPQIINLPCFMKTGEELPTRQRPSEKNVFSFDYIPPWIHTPSSGTQSGHTSAKWIVRENILEAIMEAESKIVYAPKKRMVEIFIKHGKLICGLPPPSMHSIWLAIVLLRKNNYVLSLGWRQKRAREMATRPNGVHEYLLDICGW